MTTLQRTLWRAEGDAHFRERARQNLGSTLAEEGLILTDDEMRQLRDFWETLQGLSERAAYERIAALARSKGRG